MSNPDCRTPDICAAGYSKCESCEEGTNPFLDRESRYGQCARMPRYTEGRGILAPTVTCAEPNCILAQGHPHPCWPGDEHVASIVSGVGPETERVVSQSAVPYRFDLLDPAAMFDMTAVLAVGHEKYPPRDGRANWRGIPVEDHLNHLVVHVYAWLAGDRSDGHLSHALCRAMFALACEIEGERGHRDE